MAQAEGWTPMADTSGWTPVPSPPAPSSPPQAGPPGRAAVGLQMAKTLTNALPAVGGIAGGLVGSGVASIPAAAAGAVGGESLKQLINAATGLNPVSPTWQGRAGQQLTQAAIQGGGHALGLGLGAGVSKSTGWLGERIERALLKPTAASLEGLTPAQMVKNVYKHDVGGSLGQTYDKVQAKIGTLVTQLRATLQGSAGAGVSLNQIAKQTADDYLQNPQATAAVSRILDHIEFGLNSKGIPAGAGVVNLADANVAKQAVGDMGAWLHNVHGQTVSDADQIAEKVANTYYGHLKTAIEANATGPVKAINQQLSELLPIRAAIIRRIPVAQRTNVLNLADMFGLSTHTLGLSIGNRILGSGLAANVLVKSAPVLGTAAAVAPKAAAAVASQQTP